MPLTGACVLQGNCTAPNTCTCELGWFGPDCARCVCLPGCVYGTCEKPFECRCNEGYTGLYCDKRTFVSM